MTSQFYNRISNRDQNEKFKKDRNWAQNHNSLQYNE